MRLRDKINDIINRLHFLNPNLMASFSLEIGAIKAILVSDCGQKAVGISIPLAQIVEDGQDGVELAEARYVDLQASLKIEIDGGKTIIVPNS